MFSYFIFIIDRLFDISPICF